MWGKLKLDYQLGQYWKNKFDKDNFLKKNMWENTAAKQKLYRGNTVAIHIVFFKKKKNYKAKFLTNSIYIYIYIK